MIDYKQKLIEFESLSAEDKFGFLVRYWKLEDCVSHDNTIKLVGKYQKADRLDRRGKEYGFFVDIRNTEGDILYYPFGLGKVKIVANHKDVFLKEDFWLINVKLASGPIVEKNPCALTLSDNILGKPNNKFQDKIDKEQLVKKIFNETGTTQRDAKNTANALRSIMGDLYTETERFIYELLQNADDQPDASSEVSVVMHLLSGDFLFMHNGKPFDAKDVESICSIGDSTKKEDTNKIGYKGIGFKSVFSDSETVYINSANFSFSFDKHSWYYNDVENLEEIPWQLKPIWAEKYRYPQEVQDDADYFKSPVGIALSLEESIAYKYGRVIPLLLKDPTFIIFLRNIKAIRYIDNRYDVIDIRKSCIHLNDNITRCDIFSNDNTLISSWLLSDYIIDVPQAIRDNLKTDKLIPKKLEQTQKIKITFAAKVDTNGQIEPYNQSTLYAYLPTKVSDFNFPFIINADFLTTASRETIHLKNQWNIFLFENIGKFVTDWAISLSSISTNYLQLLPQIFNNDEQDNKYEIASAFNKSYKTALSDENLILNQYDILTTQDNIILDKTGLAEIVGADVFCSILQTTKTLPSAKIDATILNKDIFEKIETIKLSTIVEKIKSTDLLNKWYCQADKVQKENLHQWLLKNIEQCKEIIYKLPLFMYGQESLSYNDIKNRETHVITTEHIKPIKDILDKNGFSCSNNDLEEITLNQYIVTPKESVLYERFIAKINVLALTHTEKLSLFLSLKEFEDVGDVKLSKLALFCNVEGNTSQLSQMLPYRDDAPAWLHPYMICQEENFEELSKFLVSDDNEFNEIVWKHLNEIPISVTELFSIYKWTDQKYTLELIKKCTTNDDFGKILPIIYDAAKPVQQQFLNTIKRLDLSSDRFYSKDSFEYQVLKMALDLYDNPSDYSTKIYYNNTCIIEYSVKDEVVCEYIDNGINKKVTLSLAKLIPDYQNKSEGLNKLKDLFEVKSGLDRFFIAKAKTISAIYSELNAKLSIPDRMFSLWNVEGNAQQYLFSVYVRRNKGWNLSYVPKIVLENQTDAFINELLNFLFSNQISISVNSKFTHHLYSYFENKYFNNDYITDNERLLPAIERWADTPEKIQYLTNYGVKTANDKALRFRQLFIEDKQIDFIDELSNIEIASALRYLSIAENLQRPYIGNHQPQVLLALKDKKTPRLADNYNVEELSNRAVEFDNEEYQNWIVDHYPKIFIYPKTLPKELEYDGIVLLNYNDTDYYYDKGNKKLYLNQLADKNTLLFEIAKSHTTDFDIDDYQILCLDGKVLIAQEEKEALETENKRLNDEVQRLKEILSKYEIIYDNPFAPEQEKSENTAYSESNNTPTMSKGEDNVLSKNEQIDAQLEAQKFLMQKYPNWKFPDGYGYESDNYSTVTIHNEKDEAINVVLKSYKSKGQGLKINIPEWDFIIEEDAQIWIYTGNDIVEIDVKEMLKNQNKLSISFNTNNLDVEDKIQQFADAMRYFNELHLDFDCFNLSENAIPIDQLYNKHVGEQQSYTDDEAL